MNYKPDLNLALIGNCSYTALIDRHGRVCWSCLPNFEGDPVFSSLINTDAEGTLPDDGFWDFELMDLEKTEQHYIESTAVLETLLYDANGGIVKITDFAPRYPHYGRYFKPSTICRVIEPLAGAPQIKVRLRPHYNYGTTKPQITRGGNHIRFQSDDLTLRLTTDAPLTYINDETSFVLDQPYHFIFGPDEALTEAVVSASRRYLRETKSYWRGFVRGLAVPFEWQDAVIRSAITLKLTTYEETGALIAAVTTSIPESADSQRNWDYRYCWIRDSLFVINALNRLSQTQTMENYLRFIMNVAMRSSAQGRDLQPMYTIGLQDKIEETNAQNLKGYRGMGPVRVGNAAYFQQQNDVWGSVILALTQAFFDKRLTRPGTREDFHRMEKFGESAIKNWDKPDAGIWEFRTMGRVHTFSAVMCWVACDRLAKIAGVLELKDRAEYWREAANRIHKGIMDQAWNEEHQSFVEPFDGDGLDSSLLLLHEVGFIDAKDPKFVKTVERIGRELMEDGLLYRYVIHDDFSKPDVAFTVCTFWYIDALAACGKTEEAREKFEWLLTKRNHVGLMSEDLDFTTGELWGNFPQTYSMVGLINSAMRLSKSWHEGI